MAQSAAQIQRALMLAMGFESEDPKGVDGDVGPVDEDGVVTDDSETAAGELLEVSDAVEEVAAEQDMGEELQTAEATLESYYGILRVASKNGGISADGAAAITVGLKAINERFGIKAAKIYPSMESYGNQTSRQQWTTVTMEGIGATLKGWWEAIKRNFKKAVEYIKGFITKVLDASPRLKKKAEALKERASNTNGTIAEKKFDMDSMATLRMGVKPPTSKECIDSIKLVTTIAGVVLGSAVAKSSEDAINALVEKMSEFKSDNNFAKELSDKLTVGVVGCVGNDNKTTQTASEGGGIKSSVEIVGGRAFVLRSATEALVAEVKAVQAAGESGTKGQPDYTPAVDGVDAVTATTAAAALVIVKHHSAGYESFDKAPKKVESKGSFTTLATSEIGTICDGVIDTCDHVIEYRKEWQKRLQLNTKVLNAADKAIAKSASNSEGDGAAAQTKTVKDFANSAIIAWNKVTKTETNVITTSLKTAGALLTYCDKSLSQYKKD